MHGSRQAAECLPHVAHSAFGVQLCWIVDRRRLKACEGSAEAALLPKARKFFVLF